jgi:hypothetical protein
VGSLMTSEELSDTAVLGFPADVTAAVNDTRADGLGCGRMACLPERFAVAKRRAMRVERRDSPMLRELNVMRCRRKICWLGVVKPEAEEEKKRSR